tara:strand:+ start:91 stop:363 length:273 start_codon:yes stop_codon:yes gene_type:complete
MILQIIDGISYVNGVKLEIETIPESDIAKSLHIINKEIIEKQNSINKLLQQRDELIVHGYNHNFSAITLAKILNLTRQRIYDVLNKYKEE